MTFEEVVRQALLELSTEGRRSEPDDDEINDGMKRLVAWLDHQSLSGEFQSARTLLTHEVAESKLAYGIGASGADGVDIAASPLPADVEGVEYRTSGESRYRLLDEVDWDQLADTRDGEALGPTQYLIEKSDPVWKLKLDAKPQPDDVIRIAAKGFLVPANPARDAEVGLPRGYDRAIITNLAVELAPSYGVTVEPVTLKNARESLSRLRERNSERPVVRIDDALTGYGSGGLGPTNHPGWRI